MPGLDGLSATDAIATIRANRTELALSNQDFVTWLLAEGVNFLKPSSSQEAA